MLTITIANDIHRFNCLYPKGPDVIGIHHNEVEGDARLFNTTCRQLFYTICHGPEITLSIKMPHFRSLPSPTIVNTCKDSDITLVTPVPV